MKREELINSKEYWLSKIQIDLFNEVESFMKKNNLKRIELAKIFGVSKGYISQILNGDADHRLSKLVEISLGVGLAPVILFKNLQEESKNDIIKSIAHLHSKTPANNHIALLQSLQSKDQENLQEMLNELNSQNNCFSEAQAS